ncbi:glutamate--tRNA ligase [Roseivivax isoporae]|uniref:Glutamate--tRNA ligase n=1 Tax=Roseivivax isoporae LMG 25204 TaxID=1449351 RepID=X7F8T2_9RHOB|nr:glutamate--tRNA ligase [Roseivivax isoporae]ETX29317.1 glutamyl-tRNA synthetase [Roseivivax isoporae LMG 25204]
MAHPVRLRIAPSPTGEPHIGTAYIALFNLLLADKLGGEMILRIEDTDQKRSTPEAEERLLEALDWLKLEWTEGPDKGGPHAPYRQSERKDIYGGYVDRLLDEGHAFKCFCTAERLDMMRAAQRKAGQPPRYDGRCLRLSPEDVAKNEAEGIPHVVRMKIPEEGECRFTDMVHGDTAIGWSEVDMQVILKSDGMPTYHLANVVDDHLMGITHVARGEEWLSSVPKHIALYDYFGWEKPVFYHLPLLRNADRSKLSKRRNPTSLGWFADAGYLPEALVNYLGLFFISIGEGEEMMPREDLARHFAPDSLALAGAVFDLDRLNWLNGRWIRERTDAEGFVAMVRDWANTRGKMDEALKLAQSRVNRLSELGPLISFVFQADLGITRESFVAKKMTPEGSLDILTEVMGLIDTLPDWTAEAIEAGVRDAAEAKGLKLRDAVGPLFVAITGSQRSLPVFQSMALIGRAMCRYRLTQAIRILKEGAQA